MSFGSSLAKLFYEIASELGIRLAPLRGCLAHGKGTWMRENVILIKKNIFLMVIFNCTF